MCLILFSWDNHPKYKLIVAANRDEFYERPTAPLEKWGEGIMAGKDLNAGGTWLGVSESGKFTALTNYRDSSNIKSDAPSRGDLTRTYLQGGESEKEFFEQLRPSLQHYNGFNLLNGSHERLTYFNNYEKEFTDVDAGVYGLSNAFLDTPWPKVRRAKEFFTRILKSDQPIEEDLLGFLEDRTIAPDEELPATGVPIEWERRLSAMHIESEQYGTCSSSVVLIDYDGNGKIIEKSHPVGGRKEDIVRLEFKWEK